MPEIRPRSRTLVDGPDRAGAPAMMAAGGDGHGDFKQPRGGVPPAGRQVMPRRFQGKDVTIGDVYEAVGRHAVGKMTDEELHELESVACPGAGACGGQFTANTMATAFEALGISPAGSSRVPAIDKHRRRDVMKAAGKRAVEMLKEDFRPSRVLKRENFDNAIAAVMATGGSTNAVLHLLACAREAGTPPAPPDFDDNSARTPLLPGLKPWGRFPAADMDRGGGVRVASPRPRR